MIDGIVVAVAITLGLYAAAVIALMVAGRRAQAVALARFVPDCAVLFTRLVRDPTLPRRRKLVVAAAAAYLVSPLDLVPDFLPVVGQADDAVVVALVLRWLARGAGAAAIARLWPGPAASLAVVLRLAGIAVRAPRQG